MAQPKSKKKRRQKRFIIQIQILDSELKSTFAYTENLHTEGMMLTCEREIPVGKEFHLELVHIRDNDERITIPLRALCMWNRPRDSKTMYSAGFEFIDLAPEQARDIERLTEELAVD